MIKFLHAADLHLGSAFASLSPAQANLRRRELFEVAVELVELCNSRECQLLLLAGDLCETAESAKALARLLGTCRAEVVIAPGNHDPYGPNGPYAGVAWPENVTVFDDTEMMRVRFEDLGCDIYGAAFLEPTAPSLMTDFTVVDRKAVNLMVLHGDPTQAGSPYNPITVEQIAASGLDYLALGHIHQYSGPLEAGSTVYAWPGCAAGRGFDETGEKGVIYGEVMRGTPAKLEFLPLSGRRYETLSVDVSESDPVAAVLAAANGNTSRDFYRVTLTGHSDALDLNAIAAQLQLKFYQLTLRDETDEEVDLWAGMGEDTLRGLFLQELRQRWEAADDPETRQTIELAVRFGLAAIEGKEAPKR